VVEGAWRIYLRRLCRDHPAISLITTLPIPPYRLSPTHHRVVEGAWRTYLRRLRRDHLAIVTSRPFAL